jgi:hypothetical protein
MRAGAERAAARVASHVGDARPTEGIHPKVVSEVLGHSSIAITLDTYSHAIPTVQETAVELVVALVVS